MINIGLDENEDETTLIYHSFLMFGDETTLIYHSSLMFAPRV